MDVLNEIHSHNISMFGVHLQHHSYSRRQVHSDSAPAPLQPVHDKAGDSSADERHVVSGRVHQLHTDILERVA